MSIEKELEKLENQFDTEEPDQKEALIGKLIEMHDAAFTKGYDEFRKFASQAVNYFGGAYIPYVFWAQLAQYMEDPETRTDLFDTIQAFANSDFEVAERKKIKPLLITYFTVEKEFEVDKIETLIIEKSHPAVQEYFRKLLSFVEKNKSSVDMYIEKFDILKGYKPDFDLLRIPLIKLKQKLGVAE